ncbi:MAG: RNA polymerase sigma factor [Defluviitaleaceae bacterium]|nr:RNA polymerase sigma factor [Defluviitaleaceae bacterium]
MELLRAFNLDQKTITETNITPQNLVDIYSGQLYKFCRSLTYSKEDAEDLFQETFIKAFDHLARENPQGLLFSTAIYIWKSWKRKYARRNRLAPTTPLSPMDENTASSMDIEGEYAQKEDIRIVKELVAALPDKFRIPTILYYNAELGVSDIALALKVPAGTVKSRLHKARKLIQEGLVKNGYEY